MNTIVCIKAVPSTTEVKMDPVTNTIIRDGKLSVINPFDAAALEEALCIKEAHGGSVIVVSMGIPDTERLLRDALARGADAAYLLTDRAFAGADTLATSYTLACGIRIIEARFGACELILCGKMAVDGDTAQIGPELASLLDRACVTDVSNVVAVSNDALTLIKEDTDCLSEVLCPLPAVVTVTKEIRIPRMPSIAGIQRTRATPITLLTAADAEADPARLGLSGSPTQVVRSFAPSHERTITHITGTPVQLAMHILDAMKEN